MSAAPVFVLAPPRSFTSVVGAMLGQHPQLCGLPEVNLFAGDTLAHLGRWHRLRPRLRHGLLRAVAELGQGVQDDEAIEIAAAWLDAHPDAATAAIHRDLAAWAAPRRLVDKSPIYLVDEGALERIHAAYPEARYIHLLRHPWGTLRSMLALREQIRAAGGRPGGGGVDAERHWLRPHLRAKEFLDRLPAPQWLRLRGEDLLADPDLCLPQIAEWLGLRRDAEAVAAMKHPERSPFARPGPAKARYGNDPGFMDSPALRPWAGRAESLDEPPPAGVTVERPELVGHYARLWGYR